MAVITSTSGTAVTRPLLPQRGPLLDAEAVLLVDHDHAERTELDALLDERVGADEDVDRAVGQLGQDAARRSAAVVRLVSRADPHRPLAEQRRPGRARSAPRATARTLRSCCSASTSVGAINAPW